MRKPVSQETRQKRSEIMKARWADPVFREERLATLRGWDRTDEYRQMVSAAKRGKPLSEAHVQAIKAGKAKRKARA